MSNKSKETLAQDVLKRLFKESSEGAMILRAVNNRVRRRILLEIAAKRETMVTDIYVKLKLEQSVASQHLAVLRGANLVKTRREGKCIYYSLNMDNLNAVYVCVKQLMEIGLLDGHPRSEPLKRFASVLN